MIEIEKKKEEIREELSDQILAFRLMRATVEEVEPGYGNMLIEVMIEELQKLIPPTTKLNPDRTPSATARPAAGMQRYIGTKIVNAAPALRIEEGGNVRIELLSTNPMPGPGAAVDMGYQVEYCDGYKSWSPQDVFEEAYRLADGLNFGLALEAAKMGKKIARRGWNGKGQYVMVGTNFSYYAHDTDVRESAYHQDINSAALVFVGTRGSQVGWLASQADMLADDWYIVEAAR